jgi:hypothetical protein
VVDEEAKALPMLQKKGRSRTWCGMAAAEDEAVFDRRNPAGEKRKKTWFYKMPLIVLQNTPYIGSRLLVAIRLFTQNPLPFCIRPPNSDRDPTFSIKPPGLGRGSYSYPRGGGLPRRGPAPRRRLMTNEMEAEMQKGMRV